jgi:hypothetical protein
MVKLNVPYLINDAIHNPGDEVDMIDEGRVEFAVGMNHVEKVASSAKKAAVAGELGDKDKKDDKDKPMGIFGKPQPEHHDDKKGK